MASTSKLMKHPWYELIHNSNLIEGIDDPDMDEVSLAILEELEFLPRDVGMSHDIIKMMQSMILSKQKGAPQRFQGRYRSEIKADASVGGRTCPSFLVVDEKMNEWLEKFDDRSPKENHIEFERIHPFADGNGRTGRLIMWWQEMVEGGQPTLIKYEDRFDYYRWFTS